jgi:hypothetical protein
MFAVTGIADSITASITGKFAGGPIGRVAGHVFLLAGFLSGCRRYDAGSPSSGRLGSSGRCGPPSCRWPRCTSSGSPSSSTRRSSRE